uniref:NADPH oxidase 5 n=1 Tax=Magallana gigas TaxID=29159 RepID=A0A8W8NWX5_MAGGI
MEDKAKLVTPEVEVKDADVRINVGNEGENGAVELDAVRTNKGRAAAQNTCCDDDTKWLACMEDQFQKKAKPDGKIHLEDFKDVLGVRQSFFAERFFDLFDKEKSGNIEVYLLLHGLRTLANGAPVEKLKFVFDVYDIDGSGSIEREELKTILTTCMEESSLFLGEDHLNDLTDVMFDAAEKDRTGSMTFDDLRQVVEKHPSVMENLTLSATQWLKTSGPPKKEEKSWRHKLTWTYFRNNLRKIVFILLFAAIQLIITIYTIMAVLEKSSSDPAYTAIRIFASVGGMLLNFNCMFVLVLVLRKCHSLLRSTPLAAILPLDQHITFHKMVGAAIGVSAAIHVGGHIAHAVYVQTVTPEKNMTAVDILFTQKANMGWVAGTAYITGWPILGILIIMTICSLPFVRRGGHFEVFYWTHMLYVPFWILLIIHAEVFWYYLVLPLTMFIIEKILGSRLIKKARYGDIFVTEVGLLPSGVCHLVISRPDNFRYRPGDYIFLQIPAIAKFEWHPFTISSAPEMKGHIWLHVRTAGHWTKQLYEYFSALDPIQENPDKELKMRQRKSHARASWMPGKRQSQFKIKDKWSRKHA